MDQKQMTTPDDRSTAQQIAPVVPIGPNALTAPVVQPAQQPHWADQSNAQQPPTTQIGWPQTPPWATATYAPAYPQNWPPQQGSWPAPQYSSWPVAPPTYWHAAPQPQQWQYPPPVPTYAQPAYAQPTYAPPTYAQPAAPLAPQFFTSQQLQRVADTDPLPPMATISLAAPIQLSAPICMQMPVPAPAAIGWAPPVPMTMQIPMAMQPQAPQSPAPQSPAPQYYATQYYATQYPPQYTQPNLPQYGPYYAQQYAQPQPVVYPYYPQY
ncbi:MAG: hypothetical protein WAP35_04140 [Solirubrobacterales bacterium]